ncbi:hypothetical protein BDN71DRAFT_334710 [Pleurotus eryngii]|uniref:Uncharacterized protein n=1 Tax=Pleurotus eryngii TaxID=5323 RepID=A0A9P5ZJ82_PLEER|nr:hypothetical protein BDN71DRAFT_334710 [Pleurotus eryngii]
MPLLLKQDHAQHKAIQQGLSHSDFSWDTPYHETRIVRHTSSPFSQRDSCLRSLRLEIAIDVYRYLPGFDFNDHNVGSRVKTIQLNIIPITSTPSHPNTFSSLNNFHVDITHSPPTDGSIRNSSHHAQTPNVPNNGMATLTGTNSSVAGTGLTVNGSVIILNVNGPLHGPLQLTGDIFSGPIYNSNVGGRYNTNQSTP